MFRMSSFREDMFLRAVSLIAVVLLEKATFVVPLGLVDYNDDCDFGFVDYSTFQSRIDESKFCDTDRGLYCIPGLGKCGCIIPHTIYRKGKCRAKIGNSCMAPGNVRLDCVEYAQCTKNASSDATFKCQCMKGYLSNAMKTACFPVGYNDRRYGFGNAYDGYRPTGCSLYWNSATGVSAFSTTSTFVFTTIVLLVFSRGIS